MSTEANNQCKQYNITLLLVLMLTIATFLPIEAYSPSLPIIAASFEVSSMMSKLTIVVFLLGSVSTLLMYGPVADHYGRKKVLLCGLGIFLLGSCWAVLTKYFGVLLLARFIQGAGISACVVLSRTILRDTVSDLAMMARASSLITAGVACASILSPIFGSYILNFWGYKAVFLFMIFYGALLFIFISGFYTEAEKNDAKITTLIGCFSDLFSVSKNGNFLLNALISSIPVSLLYIYNMYNPFILQLEYHYPITNYGYVAATIFTGEILGTFVNIRLLKSLTTQQTNLLAIVIMVMVSLLVYLILTVFNYKSPYLSIISLFVINSMGGMIMPNTFANAFHGIKEKKGAAASAYSFLQISFSFVLTALANIFFTKPKFVNLSIIIFVLSILAFCAYILENYIKIRVSSSPD